MNILIIDNNTIHLQELEKLLSEYQTKTIKPKEIKNTDTNNYDLIILSGSSKSSVIDSLDEYKDEVNLIQNSHLPIIGICFGHELIAYIYGSKLQRRDTKVHGIMKITPSDSDIFKELKNIEVYEGHQWVVKEISPKFESLATSKYGYEIIKYKNRPVYGLQFHPEVFLDRTVGDEIFRNIISLTAKDKVKEKVKNSDIYLVP